MAPSRRPRGNYYHRTFTVWSIMVMASCSETGHWTQQMFQIYWRGMDDQASSHSYEDMPSPRFQPKIVSRSSTYLSKVSELTCITKDP